MDFNETLLKGGCRPRIELSKFWSGSGNLFRYFRYFLREQCVDDEKKVVFISIKGTVNPKLHYLKEIQTQNSKINNINEAMIQTQKYFIFFTKTE